MCGVLTVGGDYCPPHEPSVDEATRSGASTYRRSYRDPVYKRNRQIRFERARGRCECGCGAVLLPGRWECHHVVEVADGGGNQIDNLRVMTRACHARVTAAARRVRAAGM